MARRKNSNRRNRQASRPESRQRSFESLENRQLLAADVLFFDSFEAGQWAGNWVEDSQNDWFTSSQRSTDGSFSAEVDGRATDATLTLSDPIDLTGYGTAQLTFDWGIESGFDSGEYLALDVSSNGGATWQADVLRLNGNSSAENTWHNENVDLMPYASSNLLVRFRAEVSKSNEDANVDNVQIVGFNPEPGPPGLVSYWAADGNAFDSQGLNSGSLVNGATYEQGQVGSAFAFDGVNDGVVMADSASLTLTESMTIETWVRVDSFPVSSHGLILFRGDDRGGLDPYQLGVLPGGAIRFAVQNSANETAVVHAEMPSGEFTHVVATLEDATGEMRLYLNSVLVASATTDIRPFGALEPASNPGIGIGNHGGFGGGTPHNFPFHGAIDEMKIYNVPLSESEVETNFQATRGTLAPVISIADASVVEGELTCNYVNDFVAENAGGMSAPRGMTVGPDGHLYVSSAWTDSILRYDGTSGIFNDEFVPAGSGGLDFPFDLKFHDGSLFVASARSDAVLRFDAANGAFIEEFISAGTGGLERPRGLLFGSNNDLYVTSGGANDSVLRYDATSGDFIDEFIPYRSGGLRTPTNLTFGPDGNLYVTSSNSSNSAILRYSPSGDFIDSFVPHASGGLDGPVDLIFDEGDGLLYVSGARSVTVHTYDIATGDFVGNIGTTGSDLRRADALAFDSDGDLLVLDTLSNSVKEFSKSASAVFEAKLSTVWPEAVSVDFSTSDGTATAGADYQPNSGTIVFEPGSISKAISVSILDDSDAEGTETLDVNVVNAVNAVIVDGLAIGTIHDDEGPQNDPNALYVYDISFESRKRGRDHRAVFEIRRDTDAGGTAGDAVVAGVQIEVNFAGVTYTGTTDSNGRFRTRWLRLSSGQSYYANAVDLALAGYSWNAFDVAEEEDDSDGDGLPDEVLSL